MLPELPLSPVNKVTEEEIKKYNITTFSGEGYLEAVKKLDEWAYYMTGLVQTGPMGEMAAAQISKAIEPVIDQCLRVKVD